MLRSCGIFWSGRVGREETLEMGQVVDRKSILKAIQVAKKRMPFKSAKQQNAMLEFAADDLAEAYRIGAEEAQQEILVRLAELLPAAPAVEAVTP